MTLANFVLFVHIVAATIWIGGQITIALVVATLRGNPELIRLVARRFERVAWTAYAVLVITGIINVSNIGVAWTQLGQTAHGRLLIDKLGLVLISGLAAAIHSFIQAPRRREAAPGRSFSAASAVLGGITLLSALGAALYGVVIANS
jgi:putative copper export protein